LAIGGPRSNAFAGGDKSEAVGHIKVFHFNSETKQWVQQGSSLGGSDAAAFGAALAMSADGQRVAGGAPEADFDGTEVHAGSVLVFHVETAEQEADKERRRRER
jgi:cyanophycinase-like exopeptidase